MRSSERTRASSSGWLTGLDRKSSAPASMPLTRSCCGSSAVHHHDRQQRGRRVGADARGRPRSRSCPASSRRAARDRASRCASLASASSPVAAVHDLVALDVSRSASSLTLRGVSSTTRILAARHARALAPAAASPLSRNSFRLIGLPMKPSKPAAMIRCGRRHDRGGDRDHRDRARRRVARGSAERLDPVDAGQLDVHQHEVGLAAPARAARRPRR